MKKNGFTLAEVLITLSIIGVVAALTAPGLVVSSRNASNAARMSVVMSDLENAFNSMLAEENVDSLFDTIAFQNDGNRQLFAGNLGKYLKVNNFSTQNASNYYGSNPQPTTMTATGARGNTSIAGSLDAAPNNNHGVGHKIELKKGATVFIIPNTPTTPTQEEKNEIINLGGSLFAEAADVYIDVNGKVGPNVLGRDIFAFYLGTDGTLYPVGSKDTSILDNKNTSEVWNSGQSSYWGCQNGRIQDGWGCTARVIEEGYKISY